MYFFLFLSQFQFNITENTTAISFPSFLPSIYLICFSQRYNKFSFLFTRIEVFLNNKNNNEHVKVFKFFHPLHYAFLIYQINSHCFFYSCSFYCPLSFTLLALFSVTHLHSRYYLLFCVHVHKY